MKTKALYGYHAADLRFFHIALILLCSSCYFGLILFCGNFDIMPVVNIERFTENKEQKQTSWHVGPLFIPRHFKKCGVLCYTLRSKICV